MTMVTGKPLMLKEYLELDDDEDEPVLTASANIPGATTIRWLLDAELRGCSGRVVHKPRSSKTALMMLSAVVKHLPFPSSANGRCLPSRPDEAHSKSFSVRLRGSLWKRKGTERSVPKPAPEEQSATRIKDIIRIRSFDREGWRSLRLPSPVASSRSSWSMTDESSVSDFLPASMASSEFADDIAAFAGGRRKDTMLLNQNPKPKHQTETRTDGEESEEAIARVPAKGQGGTVSNGESTECNSEEEEQRSPVSVIDYPYQQHHDDDDYNNNDTVDEDSVATASPTFYRNLDSIERTKQLLLLRIRRFEKLAQLDPIDLDQRSPSSEAEDQRLSDDSVAPSDEEEDEERARSLLSKLKTNPPRGSMETLLVDFIQWQDRAGDGNRDRRMRWGHTKTPFAHRHTAMLNAAREWIDGRRCTELDDFHWEATPTEMEESGRWRCFHEEEEELALQFESALLESFVEDLVQDLESRY